jgi:hypothetical protein
MSYSIQRTQYAFDMVNLKYKSRSDIFRLEQQWTAFERVENYDDIIYQKIANGIRDQTFYQFKNDSEFKDYRAGQNLHILRYPNLPPSTFSPVRDRPFPTTESTTPLPYFSQVMKNVVSAVPIPADEYAIIRSDNVIYSYVSSYNVSHVYKYNFTSDEEKMAYERGERRVLGL